MGDAAGRFFPNGCLVKVEGIVMGNVVLGWKWG